MRGKCHFNEVSVITGRRSTAVGVLLMHKAQTFGVRDPVLMRWPNVRATDLPSMSVQSR